MTYCPSTRRTSRRAPASHGRRRPSADSCSRPQHLPRGRRHQPAVAAAGRAIRTNQTAGGAAESRPPFVDRSAAGSTPLQGGAIADFLQQNQFKPHHARPHGRRIHRARRAEQTQRIQGGVEQSEGADRVPRSWLPAAPRRSRRAYRAARSERRRGKRRTTCASVKRSRLPGDLRRKTILQCVSKSRAFSKLDLRRRPPFARSAHLAELAGP